MMGGEGSVASSSNVRGQRRLILQDLLTLRARFAFFRGRIGSYEHIFKSLFEVIETPRWNEEFTLIFHQLKEYGDELHRQYTSDSGTLPATCPPTCPYCARGRC